MPGCGPGLTALTERTGAGVVSPTAGVRGPKNIDNNDPVALTFPCERPYSRPGITSLCRLGGGCGARAAITQNEETAMLSSAYATCGGMR